MASSCHLNGFARWPQKGKKKKEKKKKREEGEREISLPAVLVVIFLAAEGEKRGGEGRCATLTPQGRGKKRADPVAGHVCDHECQSDRKPNSISSQPARPGKKKKGEKGGGGVQDLPFSFFLRWGVILDITRKKGGEKWEKGERNIFSFLLIKIFIEKGILITTTNGGILKRKFFPIWRGKWEKRLPLRCHR